MDVAMTAVTTALNILWEWQKDGYLKAGTIVSVRLKRYLLN
jgi:hypothetical protein